MRYGNPWSTRLEIDLHDARDYLQKQFAHSSSGSGRVVMVNGGFASGKTAVQHDLLEDAVKAGALTLRATGAPDEQHIGGAVIDQLLANSSLPHDIPHRVGTTLLLWGREQGDDQARQHAEQSSGQVVRNVCDSLLELARERPVVIGVDDLQFADETSLKLLMQLQRRIRSTKLLILLNQPNSPRTTNLRLTSFFSRQPCYYSVHLTPMSEQAIGAMFAESLDERVDNDLPGRVHALSAGNPMLTNALVDDYRKGNRDGQPAVGAAYTRAVYALLDRPDSQLLETAAAVAVLGEQSDPELIAKLTGSDSETVNDILAALDHGGLLTSCRFRHPAAESAVLDTLRPAARAKLHARAAELKYRAAASATEVAAHLVAAGEASGEWSTAVLRSAAEQAMVTDNVQFATKCLELALSASTDEHEQRAIRQSFVWSTWRLNPSAVAPYVSTLREAAFDGTLDQVGCFALMRHSLWHGARTTFVRAHEVLASSPEPIDPQIEAELDLAYQWHFGPMDGDVDGEKPDVPADAAPWSRTAGTVIQAWRQGGSEATTANAERILQNCRLGDTALEALATAIMALVRGGEVDRAERWCTRLSREAEQRGAVTWQAMLDALWAGIALQRADVAAAAERAKASLDMLGEHNWGVSISYPLTTLLMAEVAAGAFDAAARTLRRPVPEAMFDTIGGMRYLRARGHFYLATSRPLAAVNDFQKCQRLMRKWDAVTPTLVPWRSDLAEANLQLGNVAMARELAKQQVELSLDKDPYACGLALRVLAVTSRPADIPVLLGRAAKCFKDSGHLLELNRTLKASAKLQIPGPRTDFAVVSGARLPERKQVSARVVRTKDIPAEPSPVSTTAGSTRDTQEPAEPVRREQSEPTDSTVLSEAELRVAQLAANGHTNRQIGDRLFITVSTVEQHLTRAYRKLGISGRSALAEELRVRRPPLITQER
ncbi:LuxR family transcriptional regulator [Kibdelosporangium sp. 4NS15]|uniref:LuxR family transcriptional regulator n=1 Tax=Kibdelosporangium persicum TaxID=2698649 RepID=A0ABX2F600_9PSEU|nr:LuxR family transcriptional regulator [Kibdelosporangium persicum]